MNAGTMDRSPSSKVHVIRHTSHGTSDDDNRGALAVRESRLHISKNLSGRIRGRARWATSMVPTADPNPAGSRIRPRGDYTHAHLKEGRSGGSPTSPKRSSTLSNERAGDYRPPLIAPKKPTR